METLFSLEIQSLVYEGGGFGRLPDGRAAFVPFVMPGERVTARLREEKKGFVLADLVSVDQAHAQRIAPRCPHFGICGGCHYQHIPYELQLEYKKEIFCEQLQRIGGIQTPQVEKIVPSAETWNYRNALQFQVSNTGKLCYANARDNELFAVQECHLPMPAIQNLWPQLEFEENSYTGRLEMRQNTEGELLMNLEGGEESLPELESEASVSIVSLSENDSVVLAGEDHLVMRIKDRPFHVSAASFFQTNFSGADALLNEVIGMVRESGCLRLLDVYCGVGLFSAFLAGQVQALAGIEVSPNACRDFAINLDEFDNVSLYEGTAERILPLLDFKADGVIIDPPRAGLRPEARQALLALHPGTLVYVSCNPATLARDARHFAEGGYHLQKSILVDMFPQTFHVESVNLFTN